MNEEKYVIKHDELGEIEQTSTDFQEVMMNIDLTFRDEFGVKEEGDEPKRQFDLDEAREVIEDSIRQQDPELFEYADVVLDHDHESSDEHKHGLGKLNPDIELIDGAEIERVDEG